MLLFYYCQYMVFVTYQQFSIESLVV